MIESHDELFTESRQLVETAEMTLASCRRTTADFVNVELELSTTFAQTALNSFRAGKVDRARRTAAAAREGHTTIRQFLPKLEAHDRDLVEAKLATLDPLIEQLAEIRKFFPAV
jgi:hypothetical protein